jgi:hypothetical protein
LRVFGATHGSDDQKYLIDADAAPGDRRRSGIGSNDRFYV